MIRRKPESFEPVTLGHMEPEARQVMNARDCSVSLGAVAVLVLALTGSAGGAECQFRMGPYTSQSTAELGVQQARNVGLNTSSIWGEGGTVSRPANDRYFFNVLFACS